MPIDASIAMGYKQPDFGSPVNNLAQMMQLQGAQQSNQLNQMKMDEYAKGAERTNALHSLLSSDYANPDARQTAMLKGGFLKEANDYAKGNSDIAKSSAETKVKELEAANKRVDMAGSVFGYVRQNPTAENAFAALDHLATNGIYTPEQVSEYKAKIQANPQSVAQMADMAYRGALSAKDQLAKMGDFNGGAAQQFTSTDPVTGKVTPTGSVAITESANNVANNKRIASEGAAGRAVTIRGQNLTDARSRDLNKITADNKPLTEGQSKSALFGSRMSMANKIFDTLEKSGTTTSTPGINSGYGIGSVVNALSGADQQQLMQAKRDFLNAVLRRESGAVIGESEFSSGDLQYFPQVGDTKEVKAQKKANREAAMRGVLVDVPENRRGDIVGEITGNSGATPSASPQDAQAMEWANANPNDPRSKAILQRLGGK